MLPLCGSVPRSKGGQLALLLLRGGLQGGREGGLVTLLLWDRVKRGRDAGLAVDLLRRRIPGDRGPRLVMELLGHRRRGRAPGLAVPLLRSRQTRRGRQLRQLVWAVALRDRGPGLTLQLLCCRLQRDRGDCSAMLLHYRLAQRARGARGPGAATICRKAGSRLSYARHMGATCANSRMNWMQAHMASGALSRSKRQAHHLTLNMESCLAHTWDTGLLAKSEDQARTPMIVGIRAAACQPAA